MARNLLHFSLHLLSNKTSIIIKQRRLDGKQRDSIVLFSCLERILVTVEKLNQINSLQT